MKPSLTKSCLWRVAYAETLVLLLALLPNLTTLMADGEFIGCFFHLLSQSFGISTIKLERRCATRLPYAIVDVAPNLDEFIIGPRCQVGQKSRPGTISYYMSDQEVNIDKVPPSRLQCNDLEKLLTSYNHPLLSCRFEMCNAKSHVNLP